MQTSDDELTRSGYPRNYIKGHDGRMTEEAENNEFGRAYLEVKVGSESAIDDGLDSSTV